MKDKQELIEKVVRICYAQSSGWGMISCNGLLEIVKTQLNQQ